MLDVKREEKIQFIRLMFVRQNNIFDYIMTIVTAYYEYY